MVTRKSARSGKAQASTAKKTSQGAGSNASAAKKTGEAGKEAPWCLRIPHPLGTLTLGRSTCISLAAVIALVSLLTFFWLLDYPANGVLKFIAAIGLLGMSGEAIRRLLNIEGEWGLMLLRTSTGLKKLDELSHWRPALWRAFCDFGLVFGFGALSLLMFRNISKRVFVVSLAILLLSSLTILPFILPIATSVISNLPSGSFSARGGGAANDLLQYAVLILLLLGGVTIAAIVSLIVNAGAILFVISSFLLGAGGAVLSSATPGAAPLIPGKNIPLVEGLLALAVILVVHESAHGILARLHKIKLKSAGLVFFGILPVGAFVDPEEKELEKAPANARRDVLVAGSTANFVTMFASFALLYLFLSASAAYFEDRRVLVNAYVNATPIAPAAHLVSFDGAKAENVDELLVSLSNLAANRTIELATADGALTTVKLDANGSVYYLGRTLPACEGPGACESKIYEKAAGEPTLLSVQFANAEGGAFIPLGTRFGSIVYTNAFKPGWGWLGFVYVFLGLVLVLNFLIGSINLFPLPMFDGKRLFDLAVPNRIMMKIIFYGVALAFVINLLPWLWG